MISSSRARLPDAFVRLVPILGYVLSESCQRFLRAAIKWAVILPVLRARVDYLAVHIKLKLFSSAVADAHWTTVTVTAQMFELILSRRKLPKHGVQDPEFRLGQACSMQKPCQKGFCFFFVAQSQQGTHSQ